MGRVLSNEVSIAMTEETSLGIVADTAEWLQLEPNSLGTFGASISTIVRNPISRSRQRKKGTITDLDSNAEFEHDLVYEIIARIMRGFMFAKGVREYSQNVPVSAIAVDGELTISALGAGNIDAFDNQALIWLHGFSASANNGMRVITTTVSAVATSVEVVGYDGAALAGQVTGTGFMSAVGYRFNADSAITTTIVNGRMTIANTSLGTALRDRGAVPGMLLHIGSIGEVGDDVTNDYVAGGQGYARIRNVADNDSVILDKLDARFSAVALAANTTRIVDYLFGDMIVPVTSADANYLEQSYQFEVTHPNLGDGSVAAGIANTDDSYIYSKGNYCNTIGINLPLTDKATISYNFIGTDTDPPTIERKEDSGAADIAPKDMLRTEAMNTTADIARLRIEDVDYLGLATDFKSLAFNINNNVSPEKVLAQLGARFMNVGEFTVNLEAQLLFSNPAVITAIRNNETLSMDFILKNNDGVISFDIPAMTLSGGGRDYPENETVLVNLTCDTFEDDTFSSSINFNLLPVPLP